MHLLSDDKERQARLQREWREQRKYEHLKTLLWCGLVLLGLYLMIVG